MNEIVKSSTCERADELISFLYGEVTESEALEFEKHLRLCGNCKIEMASYRQIRESIGSWKDETLAVFVPSRVNSVVRKRSALAALREFFDLSPMWMKGAVGLAALLFCVMAVLTLSQINKPSKAISATGMVPREEMEKAVAKALSEQAEKLASRPANPNKTEEIVRDIEPPRPRRAAPVNKSAPSLAKRRRPLSQSEREQLAADLRLLSTEDEDTLNLLGDRINKEF